MVYFFQTLSLKVRFLALVLLFFPVLGFQWLLVGAPWALARLKMLSHGAGVPDAGFWYDPASLQALFSAWGAEGRWHYLTVLWPSDLGFLVSYGAFLTACTLYLLKKANPRWPWWYLLPLVPLVGAGCDLLENLFVATAMLLPDDALGWMASFFTAAKWSVLALSVAVLAMGTIANLVVGGWKRVRGVVERNDETGDRRN
jgi:hypothetical protein